MVLLPTDTDERAAYYFGEGWRSPHTMPSGWVFVLSTKGRKRKARRTVNNFFKPSDGNGPDRVQVSSWSGGLLWAVAWKPLEDGE